MEVDNTAFLKSWEKELTARASRVRQLIGDAHWLSDGQHKEAIIREFLRRYVPDRIVISRGFVKSFCVELSAPCSSEVDILLYDPGVHPPWFREGDLSIAFSSSVIGHLEVKSSFTKPNLMNALESVSSVQHVVYSSGVANDVWRGIVFATVSDSRTAKSFSKTVSTSIKEHLDLQTLDEAILGQIRRHGVCAYLPNSICSFSKFVAFLSKGRKPNLIKLRVFNAEELSLACALVDLFGVIRCRLGGVVDGELDALIRSLPMKSPVNEIIEFRL